MRIEKNYNCWEKKWVVSLIVDEKELDEVLRVVEREWLNNIKTIGPSNVDIKVS